MLTSIFLCLVLSGLNVTVAQEKRTRTTLHDAVVAGDVNEVNSLLAKGADINFKNMMGGTPLHTALSNRQDAIAELLIAKGANVNARDDSGHTPLSLAAAAGQKGIVEQLLAKNVDVNVITGPGENALSVANKGGHTEIAELLVKHGAKEPSLADLEGDRLYGGMAGAYPNSAGTAPAPGPLASIAPAPVDLLADPNEIRARVKTFAGLENAVKETADKGQTEMRQWQQNKYDNRTYLSRAVQKQFEDEMALVRKSADEEKAKKTTDAITALLSAKQKRSDAVYKALMEQRREMKQAQAAQSPRGRTRGRTTGRSTWGRDSGTGAYGTDTSEMPYGPEGAMPRTNRPGDQLDRETQEEIRQWEQTTIENRGDLAKALHQQIMAQMSSVRTIAAEEKAVKTTATIDGLLLARQGRLDEFLKKVEEEKRVLQQQSQDPRNPGGTADSLRRGTGRTSPGGTMPQDNQSRTRGRRR
jgi:ankyrin repeat protein